MAVQPGSADVLALDDQNRAAPSESPHTIADMHLMADSFVLTDNLAAPAFPSSLVRATATSQTHHERRTGRRKVHMEQRIDALYAHMAACRIPFTD